jgi:hypothetical protein
MEGVIFNMANKRVFKLATASAVAASALVAAVPASAASVTYEQAEKQVNLAREAANVLHAAYTKGADYENRVVAEYDEARRHLIWAEQRVNGLKDAKQKSYLNSRLDGLRATIERTNDYNNAVRAADFLEDAREVVVAEMSKGFSDLDAAKAAQADLVAKEKLAKTNFAKVYGAEMQKSFTELYITADHKALQTNTYYGVALASYLVEADKAIKANDVATAEKFLGYAEGAAGKLTNEDLKADLTADWTELKSDLEAIKVPKVESVSAINATKLQVTFNKEVNEAAAELATNYTFVGLASGTTWTAELQSDNKTVVLTLDKAIENDTTFVATVDEVATKADTTVKTAKYTKTLTFSDTVRPTFTNAVYPKPGVAELNFSEELSTAGTVVVYDGLVESTTVTKTLDGSKLTLGSLELNKEYKVVITGAKDRSGNLIAAPIEVTVKNTLSDTVKPVATSVSSQGIDTVKVQFSEAILPTAGKYANIKVNGVNATGTINQSFDAKTNVLTVSGITDISSGDVKSITVEAFEDLAGLDGVAVTKVLSFTTAAPSLQSTQVVKEGTKTFAVLTFDKAVASVDPSVNATYVTSENVYKTTTLPGTVDVDKKQVKLEVTGKEAGTYTVTFAKDKLSDGTTGNANPVTVNFTVGTSVDSTVPEVAALFFAGETLPSGATAEAGTVYVSYSKPMSSSALNADNYKVDGSSLFSNPIFVGDKTLVKLTIKSGAITVSGDRNFSISNLVKGENNVAIKSYQVVKPFSENVKPVLTTASLVDDSTIELSLSELLGTTGFVTTDAAKSFEVAVGGTKNVVTAIADGTAGDNKVRLTITNKITAEQLASSTITVKTLDTALITDLAGNVLTSNTSVNVAK